MLDIFPRLLVGLGNPGSDYKQTRHNIGFMVIDRFIEELIPKRRLAHNINVDSKIWSYRSRGVEIVIQKPLTYMNLSGRAVVRLCQKKRIDPSEILIIYDDIDLPLGKIRLRQSGSSGGHNGVESIITALKTPRFSRLRIGVGKENTQSREVADHVLSPFSDAELNLVYKVIYVAVEAIVLSINRGIEASMNTYNGLMIRLEDHNN